MPSVVIRIVRKNERKRSHFTRERIDFIAGEMLDEKGVPLLICPINWQEITQVSQRGYQKDTGANERLVDPKGLGAMFVQFQPCNDIFSDLSWRTMCSEEPTRFRRDQRVLVNKRKIVGRDIRKVYALSKAVPCRLKRGKNS